MGRRAWVVGYWRNPRSSISCRSVFQRKCNRCFELDCFHYFSDPLPNEGARTNSQPGEQYMETKHIRESFC